MKNLLFLIIALVVVSCSKPSENVVNIYTHRHYEADKMLFKKFEDETGIKVNVIQAGTDELIQKLIAEAENSPADILVTVDAGRLVRAKNQGLFQQVESEMLETNIPARYRDSDNFWFGITQRARVIAYHSGRVSQPPTSYEDLAKPTWKGKVLVRSSSNIYNQSLLASVIANKGEKDAEIWARNIVENMARKPMGGDTDQIKALASGIGDVAVINSYYFGRLKFSDAEADQVIINDIEIIFPNQDDRGTHVNVSGVGVAKYAPNKANAIKLMEFLSTKEAQALFASANFEFPVNPEAFGAIEARKNWTNFTSDTLKLEVLGDLNAQAIRIFDQVDWQ